MSQIDLKARGSGTIPGWLRWLAVATFVVAIALIAVGASVTSTGSGDAVPDWPLSYGSLTPPMIGGIRYEHSHRLVAGLTALLIGLTTLFTWLKTTSRKLRLVSSAALVLVLIQAVLGGLRVLVISTESVQDAALSVTGAHYVETVRVLIATFHAYLAESVVALVLIFLYLTMARADRALFRPVPAAFRPAAMLLFVLLSIQLVLGALVRHTGAGLVIPDFPLAFGRFIPPFSRFQSPSAVAFWDNPLFRVAAHFSHRVVGFSIFLVLIGLRVRWRSQPEVSRHLSLLLALTAVQIGLGGWIILSGRSLASTILHVVNGTLIFSGGVLLLYRSFWSGETGVEPAAHGEEAAVAG
ncbi:MAG: hypothetical protein D6715_00600 [Calditrichaeota bacterium]|nr:MAG: hypothetical protein D6715_00600 [Calditrichota bacterium]